MKYNKMKFICSNIFNGIGIFLFKGRGDPKKYFGGGGEAMGKKSESGGVIQFSNYTPPNPTSPPYPIKNKRSLRKQQSNALNA